MPQGSEKMLENFNPHPHTEGDIIQRPWLYVVYGISIHTLTRRVTWYVTEGHIDGVISIHTLTRRVTPSYKRPKVKTLISIHTLTRRVTGHALVAI